jgi:hypothetical protein
MLIIHPSPPGPSSAGPQSRPSRTSCKHQPKHDLRLEPASKRLRRDLDILRGYDLHCKNAFWDRKGQAYVDMKWRLFGSVF